MHAQKSSWIVVVLLLALIIETFVLVYKNSVEKDKETAQNKVTPIQENTSKPSFLKNELRVQKLTAEIEELGSQVRSLQKRSVTDKTGSVPLVDENMNSDQHQRNKKREYKRTPNVDFVETLNSESVDRNWAIGTEGQIEEVLRSDLFQGTNLVGLQCRSTICEIEVEHDDDDSRKTFSEQFPIKGPDNQQLSMEAYEDADGTLMSKCYLVRKGRFIGHSPPNLDDPTLGIPAIFRNSNKN